MKRVALIATATIAIASSAFAADMPTRAPVYKAPAAAPLFDWSGWYVGGQLGWMNTDTRLSSTSGPLVYNSNNDSFAGGAFIGAQKQFGQWVLGIEGSYITSSDRSSFATTAPNIFTAGGTSTGHLKEKDVWSLGGRVGWAMNNWMPYLTGGYAAGRDELNVSPGTQSGRVNNDGWYLGGGIDWAFAPNWIFGVEYRHYDFGKKTGGTSAGVPATFDTEADTVMARLSYKFGGL